MSSEKHSGGGVSERQFRLNSVMLERTHRRVGFMPSRLRGLSQTEWSVGKGKCRMIAGYLLVPIGRVELSIFHLCLETQQTIIPPGAAFGSIQHVESPCVHIRLDVRALPSDAVTNPLSWAYRDESISRRMNRCENSSMCYDEKWAEVDKSIDGLVKVAPNLAIT